jgi:hypothetical protein
MVWREKLLASMEPFTSHVTVVSGARQNARFGKSRATAHPRTFDVSMGVGLACSADDVSFCPRRQFNGFDQAARQIS